MERKWVVAAFLDITGFRSWTYRAATAPEVKEQFIGDFYHVLQCYVRTSHGVWSKYEGDGILSIKEFTPMERKDGHAIMEFILSLRCLFRKAKKLIDDSEDSPTGIRIRIINGYVYKLMVVDPNDSERLCLIPEYLEYCTNTVRGLLEVNPEISCLATSGLVKSLGKGRSIFRVRPLKKPSCYPKGINKEDIDGLEILKF
jgi:hypothetical protein